MGELVQVSSLLRTISVTGGGADKEKLESFMAPI